MHFIVPRTATPESDGATHRLQCLLDLGVEGSALQSNDLWGRIGVVGNRRATLRAEDTVDGLAGRALSSPALGGTVDGKLVLWNDDNEGFSESARRWERVAKEIIHPKTIQHALGC